MNQLIGFTDGETTASYKYNASGLRYEKTVDGQTINHVWDGNKQIVADVIDNQFYEADCYIRGTNLVAKYNYWNGDKSEYTYYTQNAHGDVVNLTDKDGKVTKSYRYDAFGVEKNIDENDTNAFRYCGEYYDKETATVYLRARNYNPSTGRFISRDAFAGRRSDPLSLNLYTYCKNNPIRYVDPSGHDAVAAAQYMVSNNLNGSRPTKCNSDWDCKLMKKWDTYYEILAAPTRVNSNSDYEMRKNVMTESTYTVNGPSDIPNAQKKLKLNAAFKDVCNTVVVREGTGNGNRRTNATITINSLDGMVHNFLGSSLPTDPTGNYATINPGKYSLSWHTDNYKDKYGAPAYLLKTLDGENKIPSTYPDGIGPDGDSYARWILLHQAGDEYGNWSEGCITVVGKDNGIKEMKDVSKLIDNNNIGYILIVRP